MDNRTPEPLVTVPGWHHTLTAEAISARFAAASMIRRSAENRKAAVNVLPTQKKLAAISALVEGNSIRSIERMTGIHRDTIMRLGAKVGRGCAALHDKIRARPFPTTTARLSLSNTTIRSTI